MLKSIKMEKYKIDDFARINLIVGKNDIGKTHLLYKINNIKHFKTFFENNFKHCFLSNFLEDVYGKYNYDCLLIDEIENGIYPENFKKMWSELNNISKKFNTQIFATTHSLENIQAFADNIEDDDIAVYQLGENGENKKSIVRLDKKELIFMLKNGWEIR